MRGSCPTRVTLFSVFAKRRRTRNQTSRGGLLGRPKGDPAASKFYTVGAMEGYWTKVVRAVPLKDETSTNYRELAGLLRRFRVDA